MSAWSVNRLAACAVAMSGGSVAERRELLEMIGLVAPGGRELLPDDDKNYGALDDPGAAPASRDPDPHSPRAYADHGRRPDGMTTPAGLTNPPAVKPARATKPSPPPRPPRQPVIHPCGVLAAYSRHRRLGEPIDDACRRAQLDYQNAYARKRRDAKKKAS